MFDDLQKCPKFTMHSPIFVLLRRLSHKGYSRIGAFAKNGSSRVLNGKRDPENLLWIYSFTNEPEKVWSIVLGFQMTNSLDRDDYERWSPGQK